MFRGYAFTLAPQLCEDTSVLHVYYTISQLLSVS
jgi:hypothetical protein